MDAVYKQFAPGRAQEFELYSGVLQRIPGYVPKLLLWTRTADEPGILIEDVGRPLKELLRDLDTVTSTRMTTNTRMAVQIQLLQQAAVWLAQLHIQYEALSQTWLQSGLLGEYPFDSSQTWADEALEHLHWLQEQGLCQIGPDTISFIQTVVKKFYSEYPKWLVGRVTVTHGDPHLENVLVTHQGDEFRLIDWEYTCVTVPQRDLSIFVQDVLDARLHEMVVKTYWDAMREAGWNVDGPEFRTTYLACLLDNTFMMLGWEIYKFREHYLTLAELEIIVAVKLSWIKAVFAELFG